MLSQILLAIAVFAALSLCHGSCPGDYQDGYGTILCYKYYNKVSSWNEANAACSAEGAWLVAITSEEENEFVTELSGADKWIGLNDIETNGTWIWTTGVPDEVTYFNWQNQAGNSEIDPDGLDPNVQNPTDVNCVSLQHNTKQWSDRSCSSATGYHFVCQLPSEPTSQPSSAPTVQPTSQPSTPTAVPSEQPSGQPSIMPSTVPSYMPSSQPSEAPSGQPSVEPTAPSAVPSVQPSSLPSQWPSSLPSSQPSAVPNAVPTGIPTTIPTASPSTSRPSGSYRAPTSMPSEFSKTPTVMPSSTPTMPSAAIASSMSESDSFMAGGLGMILGASVGGASLLCCAGFLVFLWWRARNKTRNPDININSNDIENQDQIIIGGSINKTSSSDAAEKKRSSNKSSTSAIQSDHTAAFKESSQRANQAYTGKGREKTEERDSSKQRRRDRESERERERKEKSKPLKSQSSFDEGMEDLTRMQRKTSDVLNNINSNKDRSSGSSSRERKSHRERGQSPRLTERDKERTIGNSPEVARRRSSPFMKGQDQAARQVPVSNSPRQSHGFPPMPPSSKPSSSSMQELLPTPTPTSPQESREGKDKRRRGPASLKDKLKSAQDIASAIPMPNRVTRN